MRATTATSATAAKTSSDDDSECERRGAEGTACTFSSSCADGLFCNDVDGCECEDEAEDLGFCGGPSVDRTAA